MNRRHFLQTAGAAYLGASLYSPDGLLLAAPPIGKRLRMARGNRIVTVVGIAADGKYDDPGWVSGTRATLRNTAKIQMPKPQFARANKDDAAAAKPDGAESLYVGGFGSHHPGGFNSAFADGSARFINDNTDAAVWSAVGNRSDGEIPKGL